MPLVGVVAKNKDIQAIKKEIKEENIEVIEITKESIKNLKNIKFEEIIFLENININQDEYKYMNEIISNSRYLIVNGDIDIEILKKINIQKPIKSITYGFNSKSTITISSLNDNQIIACVQRDIEKKNGERLENQEKRIVIKNPKNIYKSLVVFIIKELHN